MSFQLKYSIRKPFENKEFGNKNFWIKKMRFQHWGLINHVLAKRFINPRGPPVLKLHKKNGRRRLINFGVLINPNLTLFSKPFLPWGDHPKCNILNLSILDL